MFKKVVLGLIISLSSVCLFADAIDELQSYEDNYFVCGNSGNEHPLKFQVSVKYPIFSNLKTGAFISYTENALWDVNKNSMPFYDYSHSPSIFYSFISKDNLFNNHDTKILDFASFGVRHKSNGKDSLSSRSINYKFVDGQISVGNKITLGLYGKYFDYFSVSIQNKDYKQYIGNTELKVFVKNTYFIDADVYGKVGAFFSKNNDFVSNSKKFGKYASVQWTEIGIDFQVLPTILPKLYFQYYSGYGDALIDYNKKDTSYRFGIKL